MKLMKQVLVIGVAALALAAATAALAQERIRSYQLVNTNFGTSYYLTGGSNVLTGMGYVTYTGGTNPVSGNALAGMGVTNNYQGPGGVPVDLSPLQSGQFMWVITTHSATNATYPTASVASNEVYQLDVRPDAAGTIWISNFLSQTVTQNSTFTNTTATVYGAPNGTNVFTGYYWARWSGFNTAATNPVITDKNQFNIYR
jgi:hypothetical protein